MAKKVKDLRPPRGLARIGFRLPIQLYRIGLGGLLGHRFLLLTHVGRKSGKERKNVLEVVRYDPEKEAFIVAVGFGKSSDWYQNIIANPHVQVQCANRHWKMIAHQLSPEQGGQELLQYSHKYPLAWKELASFMGYEVAGTDEDVRSLGNEITLIQFLPEEKHS
ncbi:MAG: nitroreductase family deazaflavin-dependent oxidoreductase [Anaerolineaceae bacterium]|jgi:deazaflavin-dependent oxidoreductase (nitroreductase family)|nr:nitroreductase family deazaflavin-dependent oxidoreductase [Anaerolineaceae bacterium]